MNLKYLRRREDKSSVTFFYFHWNIQIGCGLVDKCPHRHLPLSPQSGLFLLFLSVRVCASVCVCVCV